MKNFIDLLPEPTDTADFNDFILVKNNLPERVTERVPDCLYQRDPQDPDNLERGILDREVFLVMAWVRALRDDPDITLEEVGKRISPLDSEAFPEILKEVLYFYTNLTRAGVEEVVSENVAAQETGEETGEETENPIPQEPPEELSKSNSTP